MAKTNPTVTQGAQQTSALIQSKAEQFRNDTHRGHPLTRVGTFQDLDRSNQPYEVWYCQRDHVLFIV